MKKLVLVALVATSAFAFNGKGMVELNGCFDGGRCDNLDLQIGNDDSDNNELEESTIALNYNYLFTNHFGAGLTYRTTKSTRDGNINVGANADIDTYLANSQTVGVNLFWNFDGGWESSYAGLRYAMTTTEESDDQEDDKNDITAITLEYGKRMAMGKVFGLALHYVPSVTYTMTTVDPDQGDKVKSNELRLNVANFAVAF